MKKLIILTFMLGITNMVTAREHPEDSLRRNTIKLEISHAVYPHSMVLSYERVTKPNQTFCITGGYEEFPSLVNVSSTVRVKQDLNRSGFRAGTEYRFYLRKENRYAAPHGVYIGPYVSYHSFNNKREIEVDVNDTPERAELQTNFQILNLGLQLGYQFVINNRWTIDLITIGPSFSNYRASLKMNGDFTFDKEDVENEIILKLLERFPMLEDILNKEEVSYHGKFDSWSYGWRFQCHIGYHFGRKKK
jgi:hypothetical protein